MFDLEDFTIVFLSFWIALISFFVFLAFWPYIEKRIRKYLLDKKATVDINNGAVLEFNMTDISVFNVKSQQEDSAQRSASPSIPSLSTPSPQLI